MSSTEDYLDSLLRSVMEPSAQTPPKPAPVPEPETEKIVIAEEPIIEEPIIEEPVIEEPVIEEPVIEEPVIEESIAQEPMVEVPEFDESMFMESEAEVPEFDESMFMEPEAEVPTYEAPVMEDPIAQEPMIEASEFDESMFMEAEAEAPVYEEPVMEELIAQEPMIEAPEFDESMFMEPEAEVPAYEEPVYEEPEIEEALFEEPIIENPTYEEPAEDEDIANLLKSIGEMNSPLDDDTESSAEAEEGFSLDGLDSMESLGMDDALDITDDFQIPEESEIDVASAETNFDEMNLDDLLAGMEPGSELSEIDALLNMDSQNVAVDESVLDTEEVPDIESFEEQPEDGRKKRKKKDKKPFKFKLKKDKKKSEENPDHQAEENGDDIEISLVGEETQDDVEATPPKKAGFFSNIFDTLTKEVEDEPDKKVFEETAVDFAQETAAENEKLLEESDDEGEEKEGKKGKKGKKEKKPKEKKVKKKKEKSPEDLVEEASYRKLPLKKIIVICVLCFSLGIVITLVTFLIPYYRDSEAAQAAYDHGNYAETYTSLKGHNLNKKQQELYNKSLVIMKVKRKLDSYENYMQMNMPAQAMDALLQGLKNAQEYQSYAAELGVSDQFDAYTAELEKEITTSFGLDLQQAYEWAQIEDPQDYSRNIYQYLVQKSGLTPNGQPVSADFSENAVIAGEEEEFAE